MILVALQISAQNLFYELNISSFDTDILSLQVQLYPELCFYTMLYYGRENNAWNINISSAFEAIGEKKHAADILGFHTIMGCENPKENRNDTTGRSSELRLMRILK